MTGKPQEGERPGPTDRVARSLAQRKAVIADRRRRLRDAKRRGERLGTTYSREDIEKLLSDGAVTGAFTIPSTCSSPTATACWPTPADGPSSHGCHGS